MTLLLKHNQMLPKLSNEQSKVLKMKTILN